MNHECIGLALLAGAELVAMLLLYYIARNLSISLDRALLVCARQKAGLDHPRESNPDWRAEATEMLRHMARSAPPPPATETGLPSVSYLRPLR